MIEQIISALDNPFAAWTAWAFITAAVTCYGANINPFKFRESLRRVNGAPTWESRAEQLTFEFIDSAFISNHGELEE